MYEVFDAFRWEFIELMETEQSLSMSNAEDGPFVRLPATLAFALIVALGPCFSDLTEILAVAREITSLIWIWRGTKGEFIKDIRYL